MFHVCKNPKSTDNTTPITYKGWGPFFLFWSGDYNSNLKVPNAPTHITQDDDKNAHIALQSFTRISIKFISYHVD